jgi:methionyl aminopeptidase
VVLDGFHGDAAWSYAVGEITEDARRLLGGTEAALRAAVAACVDGGVVADVGVAVGAVAERYGLGVVEDYGGHGIGRSMWEEPHVPNIAWRAEQIDLFAGMTLAIEPMLTLGDPAWVEEADGWTIRTVDGSLAAHYEHDLVVLPDGEPRVFTAALADVVH